MLDKHLTNLVKRSSDYTIRANQTKGILLLNRYRQTCVVYIFAFITFVMMLLIFTYDIFKFSDLLLFIGLSLFISIIVFNTYLTILEKRTNEFINLFAIKFKEDSDLLEIDDIKRLYELTFIINADNIVDFDLSQYYIADEDMQKQLNKKNLKLKIDNQSFQHDIIHKIKNKNDKKLQMIDRQINQYADNKIKKSINKL